MNRTRKCCIPNCIRICERRLRFPHPKTDVYQRFPKWLEIIGGEYKNWDPIQVYNKLRICTSHFPPECFVAGSRCLKRNSLPDLSLGTEVEDTTLQPIRRYVSRGQEPISEISQGLHQLSDCNVQDPTPQDPHQDFDFGEECMTMSQRPENYPKLTLKDFRGEPLIFSRPRKYKYDVEKEKKEQNYELRNLFWELQYSNLIQLSSKNLKLYKELQSKRKLVYRLLRKCRKQYKSIDGIRKICDSKSAQTLESTLSPSAAYLFAEQFSSAEDSVASPYWTTEEKIKALNINKNNPKLYLILEKILALPPRKELRTLLESFEIQTGINSVLMQSLKDKAQKMKKTKEKLCLILFDELPLESGIQYQSGPDRIIGCEDLGNHGQSRFDAKFALVFMLRGLKKNWYMPISYYICHKAPPTFILRRILSEIVESVHEMGLKIMGIVSNLDFENNSTLQLYVSVKNESPCINVGNKDIPAFYDPPILLKTFRDKFMKYNILYANGKVAKWNHIEAMVSRDKEEEYRLASKISKIHLNPEGVMLDRIDLAAQVLSSTVASAVNIYASTDAVGKTTLPWEALATPKVVGTMDSLFDSFNRELETPKHRHKMHCILSDSSVHLSFWSETIDTIKQWKFVRPNTNVVVPNEILDYWIRNIAASVTLRNHLKETKVRKLSLKKLNLDPMRRLFSSLKYRNEKPCCVQFISNLKSFLLNEEIYNSDSQHICNDKSKDYLLADIRYHCKVEEYNEGNGNKKETFDIPEIDTLWSWKEPQLANFEAQSIVWVSAFLAKCATERFPCSFCKTVLTDDEDSTEYFVIGEKSLHLLKPSSELCSLVGYMKRHCHSLLPTIIIDNDVVKKLVTSPSNKVNLNFLLNCRHGTDIGAFLVNFAAKIYVQHFCRMYNYAEN